MGIGVFREVMSRGKVHDLEIELITEDDGLPVTELLSTYTHMVTAKYRHTDADAQAVFQLTGAAFSVVSEPLKRVACRIPTSATTALPLGVTTRLYLDWQVTDGSGNPWIVADGSLTVRSAVTRS